MLDCHEVKFFYLITSLQLVRHDLRIFWVGWQVFFFDFVDKAFIPEGWKMGSVRNPPYKQPSACWKISEERVDLTVMLCYHLPDSDGMRQVQSPHCRIWVMHSEFEHSNPYMPINRSSSTKIFRIHMPVKGYRIYTVRLFYSYRKDVISAPILYVTGIRTVAHPSSHQLEHGIFPWFLGSCRIQSRSQLQHLFKPNSIRI